MTRDVEKCAICQVELEKAAHGFPHDAEAANAHLKDCSFCSRFSQTLKETETIMQAHAQTAQTKIDLPTLRERALNKINKQKRSITRAIIGLGLIVSLCVGLYIYTGDTQILWPAVALTSLAGEAFIFDLIRLRLTHKWANHPPLDIDAVRRQRNSSLAKLIGFVALGVLAFTSPSFVPAAVLGAMELVALLGVVHQFFLVRVLHLELKALESQC